jgi:hypothetical protein
LLDRASERDGLLLVDGLDVGKGRGRAGEVDERKKEIM